MHSLKLKYNDNEKGLTLLELTVALALVGILAMVALNLMYHGLRSSKAIEDKIEIINNMNYSLGIISRAIRENKTGSDIVISSDFKELTLSNGLSFKAVDGVIQKKVNGDTQYLTTKDKVNIISLTFIKPSNSNSIKIEVTARNRDGQDVKSSLEAAIRSDI